jgi:hypothetical protein
MQIKFYSIPFYFTIFSFFVPIINHFIGINLGSYLIVLIFLISLISLKISTTYPYYFIFFIVIWLGIILLHTIFKNNVEVFGYMQSFYYSIVFYIFFKNSKKKVTAEQLYKFFSIIYKIILITLLIELLFNVLGKEALFIDFFSNMESSVSKNYQLIASRLFSKISDIDIFSLNSIFFGPQSASILSLLCLLFYNKFEKLNLSGNKILMLFAIFLLLFTYTMTASLIFLIFLFYFVYISKSSTLNNYYIKTIISIFILLFFSRIFNSIFFILSDDETLELYLLVFTQPLFDLSNLNLFELIFGISSTSKIEDYTSSWEFGLIQIIYLTGFLPIVFWFALLFYFLYIFWKIRKYFKLYDVLYLKKFYKLARSSMFVFIVSILSLIHYLSIFSTGYFQLLGFNLAVLFYSIDQFKLHYKESLKKFEL